MALPTISPFTLWFFRLIARVWFWLHFRAVRVSHPERFVACVGTPNVIVYGNHSSWWDPMIAVELAAALMPTRPHFAPMDEESLANHGILKRIGIFPVQINSPRGAAQFLRTSLQVLAANGVLWITPQGRFADTRERPLGFKPGLAALAARIPAGCTLIPLATEYPFWNERRPEALAHFGESVHILGGTTQEIESRLEKALLQAMADLEAQSLTRKPSTFEPLRGKRHPQAAQPVIHQERAR